MLNKAILMGRLTWDPELRYTPSNTPVCRFRIAVTRDRKSPSGEMLTDFFDCVTWYKQAEFTSQWFKKGMLVIVVGRIQPRTWTDKNGVERLSIEILCDEVLFGETKKSREANGGDFDIPAGNSGSGIKASNAASPAAFDLPEDKSDFESLSDEDDSEVPF